MTRFSSYPMPNAEEAFVGHGGERARFVSTFDANSGCHQPAAPGKADREKTAFATKSGAVWEWCTMPFGLVTAPASYQFAMSTILARGGGSGFASVCIADIAVDSSSREGAHDPPTLAAVFTQR